MKSPYSAYRTVLALLMAGFVSFVISGCGSSSSGSGSLGSRTFDIVLSSDNSVPSVNASVTGNGSVTLNLDTGELTGFVTVDGLSGPIQAAHIHEGIAGLTGGIVVTLGVDGTNANQVNVPTGTTLDSSQIQTMQVSGYYINIHTAANPAGEVRGQIQAANEQVIRVELRGQNEVPDEVNTSNTGIGFVTINTSTGAIRGNIRNTGLDDASAAHVHSGFAGVNGGVIVTLEKDSGDTALWHIPDGTALSSADLSGLLAGGNYFNVHTPANPSGEVRGQLIPDNIELERVNLSGAFQVPTPVISAGSAVGYITVNETTGAVVAHVNIDNLANVTVAHIHTGFAGTNGPVKLDLFEDATNSALWSTAPGASLDSAGLAEFESGGQYFNVHTSANPAGEVRGQIAPGNITVTRNLLSGSEEVPPVTTTAEGIGYATVNGGTGAIVANVRTSGLTAADAHVHQAAAGSNGGIAVGLSQDANDTDFWSATGTLIGSQLDAFNADELYFNVHTAANPGGEIRAQITR